MIPARLLAVVALAAPAQAQWTEVGNDVWVTGKEVGIGESFPAYPLEVVGAGAFGHAVRIDCQPPGDSGTALVLSADSSTFGTGIFANASTRGLDCNVFADTGRAVDVEAWSQTGTTYGVSSKVHSPDGFSGYFWGGRFVAMSDVGIGESSPEHALVVGPGNALVVDPDDDFVGVGRDWKVTSAEVFGVLGNSNGYAGMYVENYQPTGKPFYGYAVAGSAKAWTEYDPGPNQWRLKVASLTRLAVSGNGNVGIGTEQPQYRLHVNGLAGKPGGGMWSSTSDRRLKRDVRDLDGALERLLALRGRSFEYDDPDAVGELPGRRVGLIAQEVAPVFPDWVEEGDDGYLRVTVRGLEALVVEALRELSARNDELAERVDEQRERIGDLEARLTALERRSEE